MENPVIHFEVLWNGHRAAQKYYSELFGWKFRGADADVPYGIVEADEGQGIGGGVGGTPETSGHATFYVGVKNVQDHLAMAEELGGKRIMGPVEVPGGPVVGLFSDPHGHTVGLAQLPVDQ